MTDWQQIIERLKQLNMNPDLPKAQKEANLLRCKWLEMLNREKPAYTPTKATDILMEAHKDPNYRCTPRSVLQG